MNTSSSVSPLQRPASAFARLGFARRLVAPLLLGLSAAVASAQPSSIQPPHVVTSSDVVMIEAGYNFSYRILASDAPTTYSASGLPAGLTLDPSSGIIRGVIGMSSSTPFAVTLRASNVAGTGEATQMMASNGNPPIEMPYVEVVIGPPAGTYQPGDTLTFTLPCSVPYGGFAVTGTPRIAMTVGSHARYATFAGLAKNTLTFTYTVAADDDAPNGIAFGNTIDANGGSLADHTGLACALVVPAVDLSAIRIATASAPANTVAEPTAAPSSTSGTAAVGTAPTATQSVTSDAAVATSGSNSGTSRIVNLSSRMNLAGNDAIVGFVLKGSASKSMLVRAVGPGLASFGVTNAAPAPRLTLYNQSKQTLGTNSGWADSREIAAADTSVGAFALPSGSRDAAILTDLAPGAYTAQVSPGGNGILLVEVYDAATGAPAELINISARGQVGTGESALVAGFVVTGSTPKRLLVRGVGPALTRFGVTAPLADPVVKVFAGGASAPTAENDNWGADGASSADVAATGSAVGAFPLDTGSADAALLVTLPPGSYTAVVTGANGTTGEGLVEVYDAPAQ
jgi:hypothetical protein